MMSANLPNPFPLLLIKTGETQQMQQNLQEELEDRISSTKPQIFLCLD